MALLRTHFRKSYVPMNYNIHQPHTNTRARSRHTNDWVKSRRSIHHGPCSPYYEVHYEWIRRNHVHFMDRWQSALWLHGFQPPQTPNTYRMHIFGLHSISKYLYVLIADDTNKKWLLSRDQFVELEFLVLLVCVVERTAWIITILLWQVHHAWRRRSFLRKVMNNMNGNSFTIIIE